MNRTISVAALAIGLAGPAASAPLDLTGFFRTGTVSNGSGGIFYAAGLLTDDVLDPLTFNADASGGDFAGITDNLLLHDFADPGFSSLTIDGFGASEQFSIAGVGFAGDTIEFLLAYASGVANPYPGAAGAVFSLTSADFSLDSVLTLEDFFIANGDALGEFAADVDFSIQAIAAVPLPAPLVLLATGLAALGLRTRHFPG